MLRVSLTCDFQRLGVQRTSRSLPLSAECPPEALAVPSAMTYGWRDRRGRTPTPAYVSFSYAHRRGEVNYISRSNSLCSATRTISCKHRQSLDFSNFPTSEASNRKLALHTSQAGAGAKLPKFIVLAFPTSLYSARRVFAYHISLQIRRLQGRFVLSVCILQLARVRFGVELGS